MCMWLSRDELGYTLWEDEPAFGLIDVGVEGFYCEARFGFSIDDEYANQLGIRLQLKQKAKICMVRHSKPQPKEEGA